MRNLICSLAVVAALPSLGAADTSRDARIDETIATLAGVPTFEEVSISPSGDRVAFVKASSAAPADGGIFVAPVGGAGTPIRVTAALPLRARSDASTRPEESELAWSPDGGRLAFVSDATGSPQLVVWSAGGGSVRAVTKIKGALNAPQWSPDGKKIAFLFIENAARKGGALEPMTPPSGDVETQIEERRIAVVELATGTLTMASPADMYVYDYDWAPDGQAFVAEAAVGSGENNYWVAEIYRFDLGSTAARSIYKPTLQVATPRWSPDGRNIAFIEGLMSDEGNVGGDVFVMPAAGGPAVNVTAGIAASPASIYWMPDSRSLLMGENVNGLSGFARVTTTGQVEQRWSGEEKISARGVIGLSIARDGVTSAVIRESFGRPQDVWAGTVGAWKQVTHANDGVRPLWGRAENLNWTNDGFKVQGWLLYPAAGPGVLSPPKMIVQVHGGPSSGVVPAWPTLNLAALVATGYVVFMPNPRGSYGQGEAFAKANVKDFGMGDFRDILTGTDAAAAKTGSDRDHVGIWGWSYGGYMTMWAVTQTTRFRAAVSGAGLVNWESYYGQNSIDQWMIPFFGASVYDDPWIYRRSSPIEFIKNVKTPTLVLVGDRDGEVPAPQSFEFWHALKARGVKTQLIVYPNEGHRISQPPHKRDIARRLVGWFDTNL
jgi:dipeptidyl aminopeptidase/acylaminoacyl peptidase